MQHIIFDLDGTIIDSKKEILKTYKVVFARIPPRVPPKVDELNYGMNINDVLRGVYGDDDIIPAKKMFASIYDTSDYHETDLYEGVYETLAFLKEQGHELYIATNKRYTPTLRILEAKKIRQFFSEIVGYEMTPGVTMTKREMVALLKNLGSFTEGFMVGDSVGDIMAGKDEHLTTIAVTYGYESENVLAEKNPDHLIDRFHNLSTFVQIRDKQ
jgi:phosphoglycolate phosphatase